MSAGQYAESHIVDILLNGGNVSPLSIGQRIANGLALVPEDRQKDGLVQTMTVGQNLSLASILDFTRGIFTSRKLESDLIETSIRKVTVKTSGPDAAIGSLSGGNQQKVVIGKILATEPKVIMLSCDGALTATYGANKPKRMEESQKISVVVNLDDQSVFLLGHVAPISDIDQASINFGGRQMVDYGFSIRRIGTN